ncbi:MAG: hypothetical protein ACREBG_28610, partial [Pyrinomonadaceae bacterium]
SPTVKEGSSRSVNVTLEFPEPSLTVGLRPRATARSYCPELLPRATAPDPHGPLGRFALR